MRRDLPRELVLERDALAIAERGELGEQRAEFDAAIHDEDLRLASDVRELVTVRGGGGGYSRRSGT